MRCSRIYFGFLLFLELAAFLSATNCPNGFVVYNNACVQVAKNCPPNFVWQAGVCLEANAVNKIADAPKNTAQTVPCTSNCGACQGQTTCTCPCQQQTTLCAVLQLFQNIQPATPCQNCQPCSSAAPCNNCAQNTPCNNRQPCVNNQPCVNQPCNNNAPCTGNQAATTGTSNQPCINNPQNPPCSNQPQVVPCPNTKPSQTLQPPFPALPPQTIPPSEQPTPSPFPTLPPQTIPPPAPYLKCPPGTVFIDGVCRLIGCGKWYVFLDGDCVKIECPKGTHWTGEECLEPVPNEFNISYNNTIRTQINRLEPAIVIDNVNNFNVTVVNTGASRHDCNGEYCNDNDNVTEGDYDETNVETDEPRTDNCCTVITPRICEPKIVGDQKSWKCYSRRYKRCGSFCIAPIIYLKAPEPIEGPNQILLPPRDTISVPQNEYPDSSIGSHDCSGCVSGLMQNCAAYCYRNVCPPQRCRYYDQRQYCLEFAGQNGCLARDGCLSAWCSGGDAFY